MSRHREAFEDFVESVEGIPEVLEIFLFGSVARGEETDESDVDVMVIVESDKQKVREEIIDLAYSVTLEKNVYVSPKVFSREEYEKLKESGSMFLERALEEGEAVRG